MRKPVSAILAGFGLILSACGTSGGTSGGSPQPSTPITIGVSLSLSGDFSSDGKALQQGYDLWAQDVNAKGGLQGHHVAMKYVDDTSSTQQVVTNYQTLITSDKVQLVFGPFSSKLTIPASAVVDRYGYAFPEPAGGGPDVFKQGLRSIFFVQPAAVEDNLVSYTNFVKSQNPKPKTVAYATENDPFTQPQVDKAKSLLEAAGLQTVYYHVYSSEPIDWSPFALAVAPTPTSSSVAPSCRMRWRSSRRLPSSITIRRPSSRRPVPTRDRGSPIRWVRTLRASWCRPAGHPTPRPTAMTNS